MITKLWKDFGLQGKDRGRQYYLNQSYFDNIDTEEKAYWVGFIAADGCIYDSDDNRATRISFGLAEKDIEVLENFKVALSTNKPIQHLIGQSNNPIVHLEISSNQLGNNLKKLGLSNRKTYLKTWVDFENVTLQNAFIRGYFDGDGSITQNFSENNLHNVNITISGFKENLKFFAEYLLTQNIEAIFIEDKREYKNNNTFGYLTFSDKTNKLKFLELIYPENISIYLSRKFALSQKFKNLCKINPKTWKINNADYKSGKIGETLHSSWGNPEVTNQIAQG